MSRSRPLAPSLYDSRRSGHHPGTGNKIVQRSLCLPGGPTQSSSRQCLLSQLVCQSKWSPQAESYPNAGRATDKRRSTRSMRRAFSAKRDLAPVKIGRATRQRRWPATVPRWRRRTRRATFCPIESENADALRQHSGATRFTAVCLRQPERMACRSDVAASYD